VDTSLKAAETGHMVFSSIHTADVSATISRLVSFFPTEEHAQVRSRLADNLQAVISLRLLQSKKGGSRVPAVEILRSTRSIQECIKDPARISEIRDYVGKGRTENMQTFDQHLLDLLRASKISAETAFSAASNPTDFRTRLALEGVDPDASETKEEVLGPMELESDERF
jgi:twitching motility protein PilT